MVELDSYFNYLQNRSRLGLIYRKHWLYPAISRQLDGRVLDLGCGIGDFLRFRPGTVGVDINPATVAWCISQGLDARLMVLDQLPFADAEFDRVVLDNVLEHLDSPGALLNEVHRVLVGGGRLIVGVPGLRGFNSDPDHKVFYDETTLGKTLTAAGFSEVGVFHMPLGIPLLGSYVRQYCIYGVYER